MIKLSIFDQLSNSFWMNSMLYGGVIISIQQTIAQEN